MLIYKFFGELVAEVEPFLSLQKAAKSKSKSFSTRYDDARDVPDETHKGPMCEDDAPAMFTLRMSKDTEALGEEVREQRSFQTETRRKK